MQQPTDPFPSLSSHLPRDPPSQNYEHVLNAKSPILFAHEAVRLSHGSSGVSAGRRKKCMHEGGIEGRRKGLNLGPVQQCLLKVF